jgi:predicted acylesterase/phospholipase RssA
MGLPIPVQLCLQGGAAKIPFLAAFVEAVEELHNKEIRVTNVAGTSAGAIIGTLFAADVPMNSVRTRFAQAPLEEIFPSRWWSTIGWKLVKRGADLG